MLSMKKLIAYTFFALLLWHLLATRALYKVEFFKKDIIRSPIITSQNIVSDGKKIYSSVNNHEEKMIYTGVHLKKNTNYLIEFDLKVHGKNKKDFFLIYDFIAPGWDKDEHEHRIEIHNEIGTRKVFGVIKSGGLSGEALFRVFHYYSGRVEIKNLRLSQIRSTAVILKTIGYIVLCILILKLIFQLFIIRNSIINKIHYYYKIVASSRFIQNFENPREAFLILLLLYYISVLFRFAVSLLLEVPLIASDEMNYKNMAYSYFLTGDFYSTEQYFSKVEIPNVLYSYLISFSFLFKENFFIAIKLINSLIINLAVFPVYFLSKEFSNHKKALLSSILILLLPTMNYANFAMVESLYFTVFMFCFFFVYKALTTRISIFNVYAGLLLALLLLTKPNAVAFFPAFVVTSIFSLFYSRNNKENLTEHLLSGLSTIGIFLISFYLLNFLLKGNLTYDFGLYSKQVKRGLGDEFFSIPFLSMVFSHFSTLFYIFLIPFVVAIFSTVQSYQNRDKKELLFLLLGFLLFLSHLAMVYKFTLDISDAENFKRLHARYYFMTLPFFIIAFVCFFDRLKWTKGIKITLIVTFIISTLANIYYFFPEYANNGLLIVDNPYLTWFLSKGKKTIIWISIFSLMTIIYYIKNSNRQYLPYILLFVLCCYISNHGEIKHSLSADKDNKAKFQKYVPFIKDTIQDIHSNVAMVCSEWPYRLQTAFWLPYRYTITHDKPGGANINREMIPIETDYLILFDDYHLNFSAPFIKKSTSGECYIISFKRP